MHVQFALAYYLGFVHSLFEKKLLSRTLIDQKISACYLTDK